MNGSTILNVDVEEFSKETVQSFVDFLVKGYIKTENYTKVNLWNLMELGHKYNVNQLVPEVDILLSKKTLTLRECFKKIRFAKQCGANETYNKCLQTMTPGKILQSPRYNDLAMNGDEDDREFFFDIMKKKQILVGVTWINCSRCGLL